MQDERRDIYKNGMLRRTTLLLYLRLGATLWGTAWNIVIGKFGFRDTKYFAQPCLAVVLNNTKCRDWRKRTYRAAFPLISRHIPMSWPVYVLYYLCIPFLGFWVVQTPCSDVQDNVYSVSVPQGSRHPFECRWRSFPLLFCFRVVITTSRDFFMIRRPLFLRRICFFFFPCASYGVRSFPALSLNFLFKKAVKTEVWSPTEEVERQRYAGPVKSLK